MTPYREVNSPVIGASLDDGKEEDNANIKLDHNQMNNTNGLEESDDNSNKFGRR